MLSHGKLTEVGGSGAGGIKHPEGPRAAHPAGAVAVHHRRPEPVVPKVDPAELERRAKVVQDLLDALEMAAGEEAEHAAGLPDAQPPTHEAPAVVAKAVEEALHSLFGRSCRSCREVCRCVEGESMVPVPEVSATALCAAVLYQVLGDWGFRMLWNRRDYANWVSCVGMYYTSPICGG